ncbi:hypothetical protein [Staphylococcus devriesei]|uniref:Uncharacterized protein n=2 Tax=Staphylococcus devriesei TaxID=586733 RepID=A0A2T4KTI3_9STAP|nr:hypothetical protein [Staphylococcus devriesei]MCE5089170.1 hypothetical protein [Staphylococcus devriesei]MCE5096576.1 hypothetical protein [Staphylococcus devriesei]PTF03718.1 hypothetical protein BUY45_06930 [Staphylococcus devriesei]PTF10300.1 hypothetical protein BUY48_11255 [Staphylococcus devriesei]PTF12610.1 hypothetical protein BUY47_11225 [Staphylococcus devriesei]
MNNLIWQIKSEFVPNVTLNIGKYTAIYNEYETVEEDLLNIINQYFKKRNSNKKDVSIIDISSQELVSNLMYESIIIDNYKIEDEHSLGSSSTLNKKIQRDFTDSIEGMGYLNSINTLLTDLLENINYNELPLNVKNFDLKQFVKLLSFEYELKEDYSKLITRIEQVLPLLIDELNKQHNNKVLLIYLYPEANLSPKEQMKLKKLLISLQVNIIVLTGSLHFMANEWHYNNYIRSGKQKLTSKFIEELLWNAPLDFKKVELEKSLNQFILTYQDKVEINPTISNYQIAQIMLFSSIDICRAIIFTTL